MTDHQDDQPQPTADNRRAARRRMLKGASVYTKNKHSSADVQLRNISETGAKLSADRTDMVPDEGHLLLSNESATRAFVVRWRSGHEVGVEFTDDMPVKSTFSMPKLADEPRPTDMRAGAGSQDSGLSVAEEAKRKLREKFAQQGGNEGAATPQEPVYVTFETSARDAVVPMRRKSPTRETSEWAARTLGRPRTTTR